MSYTSWAVPRSFATTCYVSLTDLWPWKPSHINIHSHDEYSCQVAYLPHSGRLLQSGRDVCWRQPCCAIDWLMSPMTELYLRVTYWQLKWTAYWLRSSQHRAMHANWQKMNCSTQRCWISSRCSPDGQSDSEATNQAHIPWLRIRLFNRRDLPTSWYSKLHYGPTR